MLVLTNVRLKLILMRQKAGKRTVVFFVEEKNKGFPRFMKSETY